MTLFTFADPTMLVESAAQAAALGEQSLRPYWHVFIAYAVAWTLVFGWILSIHRRLKRVEDEFSRG